MALVNVTGGPGYLATHVISVALRAGREVRDLGMPESA